ncbi:MAG: hypothetical protein JXB49_20160 [Bacteroidales bacterium]|nr:hypothetical protein [Bacteroidales bacterium]
MKANLILILGALMVLAGTCDYYDNRLQITNISNEVITVDYSEDTILEMRSNENIQYFIRDKILPGETIKKTMPGSQNGWPFLVQRSVNNRLNLFFINVDTLKKYNDWSYIKEYKLYKRSEYSLEELENKNWNINYPE